MWSEVRSLAPLYYWYVTVCVIWSQITCSPLLLVCQCVWSEVRSLAPLYYWYVTVCVIWSKITCSPLLLVCNSVCDLKSDYLLPFIIGMSQCVWSEVRSLASLYYWYVTVCVIWSQITCSLYYWYVTVCVIWSQITCSPLLLVCHSVCDLKSDHLLPFIIGMSVCVIWSQITCSPLLLVCNSVCDLKSDHLLPFIIGM